MGVACDDGVEVQLVMVGSVSDEGKVGGGVEAGKPFRIGQKDSLAMTGRLQEIRWYRPALQNVGVKSGRLDDGRAAAR